MPPMLDLTRAKEFAQEPEQLQLLLVTFEKSLANELFELRAAFYQRDALKAEYALHALKGFVPMFTGEVLGRAVIDFYAKSRHQVLEATESEFTTLASNLELLLNEVRECLSAL